jgi:hypothetical protein
MLRRMSGPNREEATTGYRKYEGEQMKKEVEEAFSTHGEMRNA